MRGRSSGTALGFLPPVNASIQEQILLFGEPQTMIGLEQPRIVGLDMQIGIDDRKLRTFLQKQKVCNAVIRFMIADGNHIRGQHIHDFDGGNAAKLGIDHRAAKHISGNAVNRIGFLTACLIHISRQA